MHETDILEKFEKALAVCFAASGLGEYLTADSTERMTTLYLRLVEENRRYNLTAVVEPERAALLHFCDSVSIARLFPAGARVLDVGAGGGFPSLPLAIVRPDLRITALDATKKKTLYIEESARLLSLSNVAVLSGRAEELAALPAYRESFDCVTARAVAALPVLSELCLPFLRVGGLFIAPKGSGACEERTSATAAYRLLGKCVLRDEALTVSDGTETLSRTAIVAVKNAKTPDGYPRPYAKILKKPL